MRKFRHLNIGWIATEIPNTSVYNITEESGSIRFNKGTTYSQLIEDSRDWKEIIEIEEKPVLIKTYDGVEMKEGEICFCTNKSSPGGQNFQIESFTVQNKHTHYFSTQEKLEEFLLKNKVLFTTEDGVKIKHGDTYYFVANNSIVIYKGIGSKDRQYGFNVGKHFSTEQAAEDYTFMNKRSLSIQDIINLASKKIDGSCGLTYEFIDELKTFVKNKL